jgi:hypothetical protein
VSNSKQSQLFSIGFCGVSLFALILNGCSVQSDKETEPASHSEDTAVTDDTDLDSEDTADVEDTADTEDSDTNNDTEDSGCTLIEYSPNPFASSIVSYSPGDDAGFGQQSLPNIVLGPPLGAGENSGSLDVLTLGDNGEIVLGFDIPITDGPGADIIVFENPFIGWPETGIVSASQDGEEWFVWPCDPSLSPDPASGCAGVTPSLSHPDNCIDATDPSVAGGDSFDLADIGLTSAQFIRVQDSGANTSGGFDLDAVSIVHYLEQ